MASKPRCTNQNGNLHVHSAIPPEDASFRPSCDARLDMWAHNRVGTGACTTASYFDAIVSSRPRAPHSREQLTRQVSPSVVQVMVSGYGPINSPSSGEAEAESSDASGLSGPSVIISEEGYIATNAHVVSGAQRVQVALHGPVGNDAVGQFLTGETGQTIEARIVGTARELDFALLKVEAKGLRAMPFADYHKIRQGQLVFAFG